jgi:uncharacterized protein YqgV (UPF0045/DUF77 family)
MQNLSINLAIQLLPINTTVNVIELIDKAIEIIKASNLNYKVCPFETVVEGTYEQLFLLVNQIRLATLQNGCSELIINIKLHAANTNLFFEDKLQKYS